MMQALETHRTETHRLSIYADTDPSSPLDWDNMGTIACWHDRYILGDEQPGGQPSDWLEDFEEENPDAVILPVFMIDHSGIALSTRDYGDPWDSGQVGYIYCTDLEGMTTEQVESNLRSLIETYSQYVSGQVYGFVLEEKQDCGHWEETDSCWGFYGNDWNQNGLADDLPDEIKEQL